MRSIRSLTFSVAVVWISIMVEPSPILTTFTCGTQAQPEPYSNRHRSSPHCLANHLDSGSQFQHIGTRRSRRPKRRLSLPYPPRRRDLFLHPQRRADSPRFHDGQWSDCGQMNQCYRIRRGDIQFTPRPLRHSHSDQNEHASETVHFLQIWALPWKSGLTPRYHGLAGLRYFTHERCRDFQERMEKRARGEVGDPFHPNLDAPQSSARQNSRRPRRLFQTSSCSTLGLAPVNFRFSESTGRRLGGTSNSY